LDLERIVTELEQERDRLNRAIAALKGVNSSAMRRHNVGNGRMAEKRTGLGLTPAGRKRLSEAMKKRWAERKRKAKSS
jgi:chromosome segregation ATPase